MEEFELTYLPRELPEAVYKSTVKEMLDIYIPESADHPKLRIRRSGDAYEITKKQPVKDDDASHQLETTISLTKEEFEDLEKLKGKRVAKKRYLYKENGVDYEIDIFEGTLKGLVLVDVEFPSAEIKTKFQPPSWILVDVTTEKMIAGGMLCGKSYSDITEKLNTYGYNKIN